MEYTWLGKFKRFVLFHRKMVIFSLCTIVCLTLIYVFVDSYSKRYDGEFDELSEFILETKMKDIAIHNKLDVKEIKESAIGIDVSSWQKEIDWDLVKNSGIDFVMIRCGYRNLTNDEIHEDARFRYNISEANRVGIPVGVYFYSTARNKKEAIEEASFVINIIKDYDVMYPVVYDFELYNQKRMDGINASVINENALLFLDYVNEHGYNGMIYSNLNYLNKVWDIEKFTKYKLWLAQYGGEVQVEYDFLQYTDKGRIDGISTTVDLDNSNVKYVLVE